MIQYDNFLPNALKCNLDVVKFVQQLLLWVPDNGIESATLIRALELSLFKFGVSGLTFNLQLFLTTIPVVVRVPLKLKTCSL